MFGREKAGTCANTKITDTDPVTEPGVVEFDGAFKGIERDTVGDGDLGRQQGPFRVVAEADDEAIGAHHHGAGPGGKTVFQGSEGIPSGPPADGSFIEPAEGPDGGIVGSSAPSPTVGPEGGEDFQVIFLTDVTQTVNHGGVITGAAADTDPEPEQCSLAGGTFGLLEKFEAGASGAGKGNGSTIRFTLLGFNF